MDIAMSAADQLLAAIEGGVHGDVGGVSVDAVPAGGARVKRVIYPPGYRWSTHLKPAVGTDLCMHAHVGFLARGHMQGEYGDGCRFDLDAPAVVAIEPGHDAWVVGDQAAVLIEVDFDKDTARRFDLPDEHHHTARPPNSLA
jgi:hypothetical protein